MNEDEINDFETEFKFEEPKPGRLTFHLIAKRNLPLGYDENDHDQVLKELNAISHIRLDRANIGQIDSFELLGPKVTNLYLQVNLIEKIENLECLKNLTFLTLADNRIRRVENLNCLPKLHFLDLSHNCVSQQNFDIDEFPQSLIILNLKGNPCCNHPDHRGRIIQELVNLRQLDEVEISAKEKREVGLEASSDDDDEEEEEDELVSSNKKPQEKESLQSFSTEILMRSQRRMEQGLKDHNSHTAELDQIRERTHLPLSSRRAQKS
ncbi:leucine-rich repeat-containing protein 46-like [Mytilus californianus]|uniref:leucine-rich repeat-containing protein 46-like n=1 Tax=Mytilus californianus TaxID=6549 RepID=UPI0022455E1B|nr:leucine-rich repeat-containing protein 46-like [Mytilus californianus]